MDRINPLADRSGPYIRYEKYDTYKKADIYIKLPLNDPNIHLRHKNYRSDHVSFCFESFNFFNFQQLPKTTLFPEIN